MHTCELLEQEVLWKSTKAFFDLQSFFKKVIPKEHPHTGHPLSSLVPPREKTNDDNNNDKKKRKELKDTCPKARKPTQKKKKKRETSMVFHFFRIQLRLSLFCRGTHPLSGKQQSSQRKTNMLACSVFGFLFR
jgi:hypothetical protein